MRKKKSGNYILHFARRYISFHHWCYNYITFIDYLSKHSHFCWIHSESFTDLECIVRRWFWFGIVVVSTDNHIHTVRYAQYLNKLFSIRTRVGRADCDLKKIKGYRNVTSYMKMHLWEERLKGSKLKQAERSGNITLPLHKVMHFQVREILPWASIVTKLHYTFKPLSSKVEMRYDEMGDARWEFFLNCLTGFLCQFCIGFNQTCQACKI